MADCLVEELGHTAEIGLRVQSHTPELLFACTAQAMFGLIRVLPDQRGQGSRYSVTIDSMDGESLMVDWLSELLYLHETSGLIFAQYTILRWTETHLEAEFFGYPPVQAPALQIKAVTYHQLLIEANAGGWTAQVFFDI